MLAWLKLEVVLGSIWKITAASLVVATLGLTGCGDEPVKRGVNMGCTLNSDCNSGLVCSFGLCHEACAKSSDCDLGQRCVQTDGTNVCQLNDEVECHFKSDCEDPLVCAIDLQCRNQCQKDVDCLPGQTCANGGVCAEPDEVTETGDLVGAVGEGGAGGEGNMSTGGNGGSGGTGGSSGGTGGTGGSTGVGGDIGEGGMPPVLCVPGADCMPADKPCSVGVTACTEGVETCEVAADAEDGVECGSNQVCSGGACVACKPGSDCQPNENVCVVGKLSCANGPSCDVSGNAVNGTECGTDKVCALGACVACKVGEACQPADTCKTGSMVCAAGPACNVTGNKAAGTDCDTGKVCDSAAKCVACVPDAACEPTNECHQGKQQCSTGPNCVDTDLPAADGTSCTGSAPYNFCSSGTCAACQTGASCVPANPCHKGTLNCATNPPTCNEQQVNVTDGVVCGDNKSCIAGACVTNDRVLTITSGTVADVAVDAPFANVSVKLVDSNNTPLQGVAITVVPAAGAYAVASSTNASGVANINGRVGRAIGSYKFIVSAPGASAVEFTAKAVAPNAKDIFTLVNANKLTSGGASVPGPGSVSKLATEARAVASASDGTLYIASNCAVYKLTPAGVLTRIAGQGTVNGDTCGSSPGSSGAGTSVQFYYVYGLALDEPRGFLYIADYSNYRVWQLDVASGSILTYAGDKNATNASPYGDGGPAESAYLLPSGVSVAPNGDLYISDNGTGRLRKVDAITGVITSAMVPAQGCVQAAPLSFARCYDYGNACSVAWDKDGKMFVSAYLCGGGQQSNFYGVARVEADKSLSLVAGGYGTATAAEGGTATSAKFASTPSLAFDKGGNLFLANRDGHRVHRIDAVSTRITTVAGTGAAGFTGDYAAGNAAQVNSPTTLAFDDAGNLYFADSTNLAVRGLWGVGSASKPTGTLATILGTGQTVKLNAPFNALTVKLTDGSNANIPGVDVKWRRLETGSGLGGSGDVALTSKTNASGNASQTGRVGLASGAYTFEASYQDIHGVQVSGSPQVFTVTAEAPTAGTVFPVVNYNHTSGSTGIPGPATFAKLTTYALGVATASDGTMYVSDNCSVYQVTPRGEISLLAGGTGCGTAAGDSGPAVGAKLYGAYALALDEVRKVLYIAEYNNGRIRSVSLTTGVIDTLAGGATVNAEPYGDNGQATSADIGNPWSVSVDANGLVYVPDSQHNRIRVIDPTTGIITTWLKSNSATCAVGEVRLYGVQYPSSIVRFAPNGDAYISGSFCDGINPYGAIAIVLRPQAGGPLTRIVGLYQGGATTDGADATATSLPALSDFDIEANGNLLLALYNNHRIRRINRSTGKITTLLGDGVAGYAGPSDTSAYPGDYVPATSARINYAWKVAPYPGGRVLFSDDNNQAIRMIW